MGDHPVPLLFKLSTATAINPPGLDTQSVSGVRLAFFNGWECRAAFASGGRTATSHAATLTVP
jgi:hypothetical protein